MRGNSSNEDSSSSKKKPPLLKLIDSSLRLCVVPLCVATIWLTVTNHQDNPDYGSLSYTNLFGLKYMVWVSGICAGYAVVSAVSSWVRCLVCRAWFFFVSDQVGAYMMVTSMAAVGEIVYLAYKGDKEVTWSEACSSYPNFCSKLTLALSLHSLSLLSFILLSVISAFRAFSLFDPPYSPN